MAPCRFHKVKATVLERDRSVGHGSCTQAWWLEFGPREPHKDERRELTLGTPTFLRPNSERCNCSFFLCLFLSDAGQSLSMLLNSRTDPGGFLPLLPLPVSLWLSATQRLTSVLQRGSCSLSFLLLPSRQLETDGLPILRCSFSTLSSVWVHSCFILLKGLRTLQRKP